MSLVAEAAVVFVGAEAGIYLIVVGGGIAVVGGEAVFLIRRVVLQHGREPEGCHAEFLEVVEVLDDAVEVAAVAQAGFRAVFDVGAHAFDLLGMVGTLCKTVGHEHVEHVGIGEADTLFALHLTGFQLIGHLHALRALDGATLEGELHRAGLGLAEVHVDEQVVGGVEAHEAVDGDTGVVGGDILHIADALSIDHQLHLGILHPHIPVGGLNPVNHCFFCCTHRQYVCHQDGGYQ